MSLSIQKMVSDGTLSTIVLGVQYLQRNDVYVRIAGVETPQSGAPSGYTWSFVDNNTIRVLPVVPAGVEVVVYRRTDIDAMYNIYSQNAQFDESTIDENNQQLLFIAQEYFEQGVPVQLIDSVEYVREDTTTMYYRLKLSDGSYTAEFPIPKGGAVGFEALRRTYLEAGLTLVEGSFETGGVLSSSTDVLLHNITAKAYAWSGVFPHTVAPGTDPTAVGSGYAPRTDVVLRNELAGIGGESLVGGATYAQIRAYTGTGTEIKCLGHSNVFDGAYGNFVLDSSDTSSTDNDGTVLVDALNRRWKRAYSVAADAAWFGIVADSGVTDNAPKINAALQAVKRLKIKASMGSAYYGVASPVYIDSEMGLESYGGAYAEIRKTTNTLGSGSNTIGGQTDSYAKDAVIILRHTDGAYNNWSTLSGIIANGAGMGCEYGVYAPRVAHGVFDRVLSAVGTGMYGWVTHDTYMTRFEDVQVTKSYIARAGSIGFYWDDKGDGSSGTSCAFINCWARDGFDIGWKLTGLVYSSISSSGSDRYGSSAIYAELCDLSIDSFGFENRLAGSVGSPLTFRYSRVDGGVFVGFSADVSSGDYVLNVQGGRFKYHYIRHTSLSGSTGNSFRAADNAVILSTGGESFGAGVITTPSVDSTSAIIPTAGKTDDWTPSIAGASTAGTYQLAMAIGKISRAGNSVTLTGQIVLAATVTGGGSGGLRIRGIPIAKPNNGVTPTGSVVLNGVTFTGNPVLSFTTGAASSELYIALNATGAAPGQIAITDVGANDSISFSITYAV